MRATHQLQILKRFHTENVLEMLTIFGYQLTEFSKVVPGQVGSSKGAL